jgi:hypothetical protein
MLMMIQATRKKLKQKGSKIPFVGTAIMKENALPMAPLQSILSMGFSGESGKPAAPPANPPLTPEETGVPSVELIMKILEVHIESLNRCRELSKMPDLSKNGGILFKEFVDTAGTQYLQASLEM